MKDVNLCEIPSIENRDASENVWTSSCKVLIIDWTLRNLVARVGKVCSVSDTNLSKKYLQRDPR